MPTYCIYPSCIIRPSYDYPDYNRYARYRNGCVTHKYTAMIDTRSTRCIVSGCINICPAYNYPGLKPQYCRQHMTIDMINIRNKNAFFKYSL